MNTGHAVYLGAKRWPASRRMHWPLSIGFSTIASASLAYSSGLPSRFGNAASLVSALANSSGMPCGEPGGEQAGRDREHPDAQAAEVARHRQAHAGDRRLGRRVGDLPDLSLERRDRRRVDDDAALLGLVVDGSFLLICQAANRLMLKVPIRLRSTDWRKESRLCGPSC